jgi:hypothetical protein
MMAVESTRSNYREKVDNALHLAQRIERLEHVYGILKQALERNPVSIRWKVHQWQEKWCSVKPSAPRELFPLPIVDAALRPTTSRPTANASQRSCRWKLREQPAASQANLVG